jgi:uncharacterized protein
MDVTTERDIETAARILREQGATEVFVFGSAASDTMRPESDIDLAVRGLPPEKFFRSMSLVTVEISRPLDLIDLDDETTFTQYLQKKGKLRRVA